MAAVVASPRLAPGQRRRMGLEEWLILADQGGPLTEWVDGEAIVFEMPTEHHQDLAGFFYILLSWFSRRHDLGKVLIAPMPLRILEGGRWREPDILFVSAPNAERRKGMHIDGPADLVIEIVSEDSVGRDTREKLGEYAAAGIPEYWLVESRPGRREARFFLLGEDGTYRAAAFDGAGRYRSLVLPGFWVDPAWFWQEPLPDPDELKPLILGGSGAA